MGVLRWTCNMIGRDTITNEYVKESLLLRTWSGKLKMIDWDDSNMLQKNNNDIIKKMSEIRVEESRGRDKPKKNWKEVDIYDERMRSKWNYD